jgi:hypothetical protein
VQLREDSRLHGSSRGGSFETPVEDPPLSSATLRFNHLFAFETDLFKGTAIVYLNRGRNTLQYMVQGMFKRDDIRIDSVKTGHIFRRPLKLPSSWLVSSATAVIKALLNNITMKLDGPEPHCFAPFCVTMDTLNVAWAGAETPLSEISDKPLEDCRLLHPMCADAPTQRAGRVKALLKLPPEACFNMEHVHTFELCIASGVKLDTWYMDVPLLPKLDIAKVMNHQPLYITAFKEGRRTYAKPHDTIPSPVVEANLFKFEIWHERILPDEDVDGDEDEDKQANKKQKASKHPLERIVNSNQVGKR